MCVYRPWAFELPMYFRLHIRRARCEKCVYIVPVHSFAFIHTEQDTINVRSGSQCISALIYTEQGVRNVCISFLCILSPSFSSSHLSVYVFMYLSIYLFMYLPIYLSIYLCIYLSIYLS